MLKPVTFIMFAILLITPIFLLFGLSYSLENDLLQAMFSGLGTTLSCLCIYFLFKADYRYVELQKNKQHLQSDLNI